MKRIRPLLASIIGAAMLAGCGASVGALNFPTPPVTVAAPTQTVVTLPDDLSSLGQTPVPGTPTSTVPAIGPGGATLGGTVTGPAGPVGGATVQVERMVGDSETSTQATTAADGSWTVANILGGRFLVRAWQSPSLDLTTPQVVFVSATQSYSLTLQLTQFKGPTVASSTSPATPVVGQPANLLIQVTNPVVGPDGVLRYPPDVGAVVSLTDGPGWQLDGGSLTVNSDIAGNALFQLTCTTVGVDPLSVQVASGLVTPLKMPSCSPVPTTVPTTTASTLFPCPSTTVSTPPPGQPTTTTAFSIGGC